jgi:hypothetical protein
VNADLNTLRFHLNDNPFTWLLGVTVESSKLNERGNGVGMSPRLCYNFNSFGGGFVTGNTVVGKRIDAKVIAYLK